MKNILSELLMRKLEYFEKKKFDGEKEKYYCYCESIYNEDETWIGCDSETSKWEWFHLTRVKVTGIIQYVEKKGSHTTKTMKIAKRNG